MGSLEDALYLTSPLATSTPQVIRSEILANGAPPQMTKDGPKPATRKIIAQAAARKEGFLRAVLDAKRLRGYDCDWLVQPLCLGVFRRDNSTTEQSRLAIEVLRECNSLDPSDEPVLAETIRLGIVERKVTGLRINNLGVSDTPSTSVSGGSSQRTAVHFKVLTLAPARVGAVVLWRERERFVKLISGENVSISETETGSRVAAIVAAGACLSRVDGVERLVQYAPSHTDATGARGDGARFLIDVWRRIVIVAEDTRAPDQVTVAKATVRSFTVHEEQFALPAPTNAPAQISDPFVSADPFRAAQKTSMDSDPFASGLDHAPARAASDPFVSDNNDNGGSGLEKYDSGSFAGFSPVARPTKQAPEDDPFNFLG